MREGRRGARRRSERVKCLTAAFLAVRQGTAVHPVNTVNTSRRARVRLPDAGAVVGLQSVSVRRQRVAVDHVLRRQQMIEVRIRVGVMKRQRREHGRRYRW